MSWCKRALTKKIIEGDPFYYLVIDALRQCCKCELKGSRVTSFSGRLIFTVHNGGIFQLTLSEQNIETESGQEVDIRLNLTVQDEEDAEHVIVLPTESDVQSEEILTADPTDSFQEIAVCESRPLPTDDIVAWRKTCENDAVEIISDGYLTTSDTEAYILQNVNVQSRPTCTSDQTSVCYDRKTVRKKLTRSNSKAGNDDSCRVLDPQQSDGADQKPVDTAISHRCYVCKLCGKNFVCAWAVKRHVRLSHVNRGALLVSNSYAVAVNGKRHAGWLERSAYRSLYKKQLPPFECVSCPETFHSLQLLTIHRRQHHLQCTCHLCCVSFVGRLALVEHVRTAHPGMPIYKAKSRFTCGHCGVVCAYRRKLEDHIATCHQGLIHRCTICAKTFNSEETLQKHMQHQHDPNRRKICDACGLQFALHRSLLEHLRIEHPGLLTDEQRQIFDGLICTSCGMAFTRASSLQRHIDAKHASGDNVHMCAHCSRIFTCRRYLLRHTHKYHQDGKVLPGR